MAEIELKLTKTTTIVNGKSVTSITTDHTGYKAILTEGDTLKITLDPNGNWSAADGITSVKFYDTQALEDAKGVPHHQWTEASNDLAGFLTFAPTKNASQKITTLAMTDAEGAAAADKTFYYLVTAGGIDLDPELVNKAGNTDREGGRWVSVG